MVNVSKIVTLAETHQYVNGDIAMSLYARQIYIFSEIIHRIDLRLITVAGIIYMNSLMDRSNLPNAGIAGMRVDLNMEGGSRYVGFVLTKAMLKEQSYTKHLAPWIWLMQTSSAIKIEAEHLIKSLHVKQF